MKKSTAWITALLIVPLAAWISRAIIVSAATPTADSNLLAYCLLIQASQANDIAAAKNLATQAGSMASDERLRSASAGVGSMCDSCLQMGVTTKAEANDLGGFIKGFTYGLGNPVGGLLTAIKGLITEGQLEQQGAELDSIYLPKWNTFWKKFESAKSTGTTAMVIILGAGWAMLWKISMKSVPHAASIHTPQTRVDPGPVIVVCGQCGARNRPSAHCGAQKLVCGNCKTQLVT